jgi:hypothetical protein
MQANKLDQCPSEFLSGAKIDEDFYTAIPDLYLRDLTFQPLFPTGCTLRRQFAMRLNGFDTKFNRVGAEDWEFTLRAILAGNVALSRQPLAQVRKHSGNDSGNATHMFSGEIRILEHSLAHHAGAAKYSQVINAGIDDRRVRIFDTAFADGNFDLTSQMLSQMASAPQSLKFWTKRFICQLPHGLRSRVWAMCQKK